MSNFTLGLLVEGAVAILLILTIGYCYILNVRLKRLREDRNALQTMITDLVRATDQANGAITELRKTAIEADGMIQTRLSEAETFSVEMAHHVNAGQSVIHKISQITTAVRAAEPKPQIQKPKARAALDQMTAFAKRGGEAA